MGTGQSACSKRQHLHNNKTMGLIGCKPKYPLDTRTLRFDLEHRYNALGKLKHQTGGNNATQLDAAAEYYYSAQRRYWEKLSNIRAESVRARSKLADDNWVHWQKKYPTWSEADFVELRDHFNNLDVNKDGMIDLQEFNSALDKIDHPSTNVERRRCFEDVDADGSGAVDFEEFLELVHRVNIGTLDVHHGFGIIYKWVRRKNKTVKRMPGSNCCC